MCPSGHYSIICNSQDMETYLLKKNEILPFAITWTDLEGIMLSEMSDKERQIPYDITYVESKKQTSEYNKKRNRHREQTSSYQWWEERKGGQLGLGD